VAGLYAILLADFGGQDDLPFTGHSRCHAR